MATLLDQVGLGAERRLQLRKFSKGMVQRVGIAQALINDPEVVFLDEPMSGLDPLGRREVRTLILDLRDQGRTVFFSSHILADAEALCSRVAVVAGGRLAAAGRLTDILAFEVRGWELVIADVTPEVLARFAPMARRTTEISAGRYALELSLDQPPERVLADLAALGASLVSLNPIRDTLEDFFVRRVAEAGSARRGSSEGAPCARLAASPLSVFRESVRDRVPYNLVLFAVLLIASSFLLGQLTAGQDVKIIKDLGLAATAVFGLFIAIFIGIGLVSKEVERRSIYALLAKPISRPQFILGKYAGLVLTLAVNVAVMTVALYAVLAYMTWTAVRGDSGGLGRARHRSGAAQSGVPDLRRADAHHGARALLLDVLDAAAVRRVDLRPVHRRALQRRPAELRAGRRSRAAAWLARGALPRPAGSVRVRRQDTSRPRLPVPPGYRGADDRLRPDLHRCAPPAGDGHFLAAGLQMTPLAPGGAQHGCRVPPPSYASRLRCASDRARPQV